MLFKCIALIFVRGYSFLWISCYHLVEMRHVHLDNIGKGQLFREAGRRVCQRHPGLVTLTPGTTEVLPLGE